MDLAGFSFKKWDVEMSILPKLIHTFDVIFIKMSKAVVKK